MKIFSESLRWIVAALVIGGAGKEAVGFTQQPQPVAAKTLHSGLPLSVVLKSATIRRFTLYGVGCSSTMCSRITINTRERGNGLTSDIRLESIAAIRGINDVNAAVIFRNGDERQMSVAPFNRVLYVINESDKNEKLDLSVIDSIEFLTPNPK